MLRMLHVSLHLLLNNILTRNIRIITIEQPRHLLKRRTLSLDVVEVDDHTLNDEDDNVYEVVLPCEMLETDWVDVLVEDRGGSGGGEAD